MQNLSTSLSVTAGFVTNGYVSYYAKNVYTATSGESALFEENGYIFFDNGTERYLMGYRGTDADLTLPADCNNNPYAIYQYAFHGCESMLSVTIPNGVTAIGTYAFYYCQNLTRATLGANVSQIDDCAFATCYKMVEVKNLSTLDIEIGSMTNGEIGARVKHVYTATSGESKVFEADGFIFFDNGTERYLLGYRGNAGNLILPAKCNDNPYAIYDFAFFGRMDLTGITIPEGVSAIGNLAFEGCLSLANASIAASVETMATEVFRDCVNLATVTFGENSLLSSIGWGSFCYCLSLSGIELPAGVTALGSETFSSCINLESVKLSGDLTLIDGWAFFFCGELSTIVFGGTTEQWLKVETGMSWNDCTATYTVICTDGTVAKDGIVTPS